MEYFDRLDQELESMWSKIINEAPLFRAIDENRVDKKLYALYMIETYHYTLHNARNQALVGVRAYDVPPKYTKFCFEHAAEETGHELMALHDVKSLGLSENFTIPPPLPETETLIAYLYWISATGNPMQRLGYSYWAENVYHYIMPYVRKLQEQLGLQNNQLTFFIAHSDIDEAHAAEVREIIERHANTDEDREAVARVMRSSLYLTGEMLHGAFRAYGKLRDGEPGAYGFLQALD